MQSAHLYFRDLRPCRFLLCLVLGLFLVAGRPHAKARTLPQLTATVPLPIDGPPPAGRAALSQPNQVTVELHKVEAVVDGPIATVSVTQIFRNDGGQAAEGIYVSPCRRMPRSAIFS